MPLCCRNGLVKPLLSRRTDGEFPRWANSELIRLNREPDPAHREAPGKNQRGARYSGVPRARALPLQALRDRIGADGPGVLRARALPLRGQARGGRPPADASARALPTAARLDPKPASPRRRAGVRVAASEEVRLLRLAVIVLFASMLLVETGRAVAQSGENPCRSIGTDDTVRPIPQSLVPVAKRIFGLRMEDQQVRRSTVFRCADGHILLCNYGANLPCGKANADHRLPQAEAWCRDHADTDFIPRYVLPTRLATSIIGAVPPAPQRSSHRSRPSTRAASSPDIGSRQISRVAQGDP